MLRDLYDPVYHGQQRKAAAITVTTGSNTAAITKPCSKPSHGAGPHRGADTDGDRGRRPVLTCSQGSWLHEPTYLLYQWMRNGTVISGQTGTTYTLQAADQGQLDHLLGHGRKRRRGDERNQ